VEQVAKFRVDYQWVLRRILKSKAHRLCA